MSGKYFTEIPEISRTNIVAPETNSAGFFIGGLRLLWQRRRWTIRLATLGAIVGAIIAFSIPRRFQATTQLLVGSSSSNSVSPFLGSGPVLIGILKSRAVQDRLIARFDLRRVYRIDHQEQVRAQLTRNTVFDEASNSGIISVTVTDKQAKRAADLGNAYREALNEVIKELANLSINQERLFLKVRVGETGQELKSSAKALSDFASNNGVVDIQQQGEILLQSEISLDSNLIEAKLERKSLQMIYAEGNPKIRELSAKIQRFQNGIGRFRGNPVQLEDVSTTSKDSVVPSIRKLPLLDVAYSDLSRDSSLREANYDTLSTMSEVAETELLRPISIAVLDVAVVPEKSAYPPRILITLSGALLSGAAGIFWIVGLEYWRKRF